MTVRGCVSAVALVALLAVAARVGTAEARTIRVKWTDRQPLDGGHIVYHTTKIWVHDDRFSVTVAVTNRTKYPIRFFPATGPDDPAYIPIPGFGIAWRDSPQKGSIQPRRLRTVVPHWISQRQWFSYRIVRTLGVGKTLNLTFSGRSRLLRTHRTWWVTFGRTIPWKGKRPVSNVTGPHDSYWISDKTFAT
jgi:hypothetical protein